MGRRDGWRGGEEEEKGTCRKNTQSAQSKEFDGLDTLD